LQPGPREDLKHHNWVLAHRDREAERCRSNSAGGEGEPARKVLRTRANLARVMCRSGVTRGGGIAAIQSSGGGA
jgi:hypothetical protein